MPTQRTSAPERTTPERIAAARQVQLYELYTQIQLYEVYTQAPTLRVVGSDSHSDSHPARCRAVLDGIVADAKVDSLSHHAGVAVLTRSAHHTETLTALHGVTREGGIHAVLYAVRVDGWLTYEKFITDRDDPLFRLAIDIAAR